MECVGSINVRSGMSTIDALAPVCEEFGIGSRPASSAPFLIGGPFRAGEHFQKQALVHSKIYLASSDCVSLYSVSCWRMLSGRAQACGASAAEPGHVVVDDAVDRVAGIASAGPQAAVLFVTKGALIQSELVEVFLDDSRSRRRP